MVKIRKPRGPYKKKDPRPRFWEKVEKTESCWIWTGARSTFGYGKMYLDGAWVDSHRISWIWAHGVISKGLWVCHHCDNPPCVRPEHLFLGTCQDNAIDCRNKGRTHIEKPKLSTEQVLSIRERYASGESAQSLANKYGVSCSVAFFAATRRSYKWIL